MQSRNLLSAVRIAFLGGALFLSTPAAVPAADQAKPSSEGAAPASQALSEWRKQMIANRPRGGSCFTATYPDPKWRSIDCVPIPHIPMAVGNAGLGGMDYGPATNSAIAYASGPFLTTPGGTTPTPGLASEYDGVNPAPCPPSYTAPCNNPAPTGGQSCASCTLSPWRSTP